MTKKLLTIICLLFFLFSATAQDTIVMQYGQKVACQVISISQNYIKCRLFDATENTTTDFLREEVYSIKYANGEEVVLEQLQPNMFNSGEPLTYQASFWGRRIWQGEKKLKGREVKSLLSHYTEALDKYKTSKTLEWTSGIIIGISGGVFAFYGIQWLSSAEINNFLFAASAICLAGGITMEIFSVRLLKKSLAIYNSASVSTVSIDAGFNSNGIGLILRF